MIKLILILAFAHSINVSLGQGQQQSPPKSRIVFGLSSPELFHLGYGIEVAKNYQLGVTAGVGPSWGTPWPQLSLEQRFYLKPKVVEELRGRWFFRQGINYFPLGEDMLFTLSAGKDSRWNDQRNCWTFDVGISTFIFYNRQYEGSEPYYNFLPVLRIQYVIGVGRK